MPVAINADSHIALLSSGPPYQPLIWSNGKTTPLANYKNGALLPIDINDHDEVAAIGASTSGPAVFLTQSTAQEIAFVLPAVVFSPNPGLYVNNAGNVAGNSQHFFNQRQVSRAFLWTQESGAIDLGTPGIQSSFVKGLDDHNRVLGYLDRDGGTPFVWQAGIGITELTSLIDLGDQYARMQSVAEMNSRGEILGSLLDKDGRPHIVVLVPVPEPAVLLIGAVGMLAGVWIKCRRARVHGLVAQRHDFQPRGRFIQ